MKANELMLGDYIYAQDREGGNKEGEINIVEYPIRVESIYGDTLLDNYGCERGEGDFAGIPLTSEILENNLSYEQRNGFISWVKDVDCETCFDIEMLINSIIIEKQFEYVHQLQHALRLCGIDEDIKL